MIFLFHQAAMSLEGIENAYIAADTLNSFVHKCFLPIYIILCVCHMTTHFDPQGIEAAQMLSFLIVLNSFH